MQKRANNAVNMQFTPPSRLVAGGFKPYPEYKPTGLTWLPQVPAGWGISKLGRMLKPFSEKGHPEAQLLSVVREKGVIVRDADNDEDNHNFIPDDLSSYKYVKCGQFAMNKMKAWQGSYGVSQYCGIVSPAYFVFDITTDVEPSFFHAAIRSKAYVPYFGRASDGIRVGQWDLSLSRMREIPFLLPSPDEQRRIVAYLDEKTAKIDRLIALKEREIELLNEKKQAMISRVVTRGLNPNVARPVVLLSRLVSKIGSGKTPTGGAVVYSSSGIMFIRSQNVYYDGLRVDDISYISAEIDESMASTRVYRDDVLLNITGGSIGRCLWYCYDYPANVNQHVCIIRPRKDVLESRYLAAVLYSLLIQNEIRKCQNEGNRESLNFSQIGRFMIPVPPLAEQREIVAYLDKATAKIDAAVAAIEKSIGLLKERRTRLVSDAVTGRIDLRKELV